jgi:hypothetical protein
MSALSSYLENKIADHVLGGTVYTPSSTVYFALFTASPTEAGGGTEVSTSGTGYTRVAVTNNATNFPAASNGEKYNAANVTFPISTSDWGTISAFGIYDSGGSNLLFFGALSASRNITTGDTARFTAGDFRVRFE